MNDDASVHNRDDCGGTFRRVHNPDTCLNRADAMVCSGCGSIVDLESFEGSTCQTSEHGPSGKNQRDETPR